MATSVNLPRVSKLQLTANVGKTTHELASVLDRAQQQQTAQINTALEQTETALTAVAATIPPSPAPIPNGTFGDSTDVAQVTVAGGVVTNITNVPITFPTPPPAVAPGMGVLVGPGLNGSIRAAQIYIASRFSPNVSSVVGGAGSAFAIGVSQTGTLVTSGTGQTNYTGDTQRPMVNFNTGGSSGNLSGVSVAPVGTDLPQIFSWQPILQGTTQAITATSVRLWFGLAAITGGGDITTIGTNATNPTIAYALFRYDTSVPDTHWMACTSTGAGGGAHTETSTGVSLGAGTSLQWCIDGTNLTAGSPSVDFWIAGIKTTISTNVPPIASQWQVLWSVTTLTGTTANAAFGSWSVFTTI